MKDKTNYEQFDVDKEDEKIKPKKVSKTKYYVIILFLILLNVAVIIMLIKSKITNTTEEIGKDDLKFLLVSDIHDNVTGLDLLLNKVKSKKYSYIFYMGDMVKMTPGQQNSSEHAHIYEQRMTQYLEKLEQIAPVLYIPGNNEPYTIYEKNFPKLTKKSTNVHKNYIKIKDDLFVMGLGGCVPILNGGKYDKNVIPFSTLDTTNVIQNGFPYNLPEFDTDNYKKSDEWFGNDIRSIIDKVKKDAGNKQYQTILLSHNGPLYSWTNAQQQLGTGEHWLYLGSMELEKIFINDENLILDIHGHIHPSRGIVTMIPNKVVVNPGAIVNGFFGEISLKKFGNKWTVNSMNLLEL